MLSRAEAGNYATASKIRLCRIKNTSVGLHTGYMRWNRMRVGGLNGE